MPVPDLAATPWRPLGADRVADALAQSPARWWLSGGVALDRWLGAPIRERQNIDVSTIPGDLGALVARLPARFSAWVPSGDEDVTAWGDVDPESDIQHVYVRDEQTDAWALRINVEDGTERTWLYRRDPRLQLPWGDAVIDLDGVPTGAPEVQLVWKALRPRPEDDLDKEAVLPHLTGEQRAWWERAMLRIHPHSAWAIPVRSPLFPGRPSWNRP